MPLIVYIETASPICSVCLGLDGKTIKILESKEGNSHSTILTILINNLFEETGYTLKDIDAVCVSAGPGSYTGLRIGVSVAKGLCYALGKPIISVSTLKAMANGAKQYITSTDTLLCPMIDARRLDVYTAIYNSNLKNILSPTAITLNKDEFNEYSDQPLVFFGSGTEKLKDILSHPKATFIDAFSNSAQHLLSIGEKMFKAGRFANLASFEPFYLKSFYTKPN